MSKSSRGFICTQCQREHEFSAYVYAHWDISLTHTCEHCQAKHTVLQGEATLSKKPFTKAKKLRPKKEGGENK